VEQSLPGAVKNGTQPESLRLRWAEASCAASKPAPETAAQYELQTASHLLEQKMMQPDPAPSYSSKNKYFMSIPPFIMWRPDLPGPIPLYCLSRNLQGVLRETTFLRQFWQH
jgi:hypothetical protein